jgi:lycopene beta-cyclase
MPEKYDFIVTGGGAAGLSFIYQLLNSPLRQSSILLIDKEAKDQNDRTWCFWEKEPGPFNHIVFHQWNRLWFHQGTMSQLLDITPYIYKVIRGIDFYRETDRLINAHPNVVKVQANVERILNTDSGVSVWAGSRQYEGTWCINSIPFFQFPDKKNINYLDQHFRGWFIRTADSVFDPMAATMMDFRIPQSGETRFVYVLPYSNKEALIEVAIFSNTHLSADGYDDILRAYVRDYLPAIKSYDISQIEYGNIPMTDYAFASSEAHILHLGMAGGDTRASTGYTFWNIQQRVAAIIYALTRYEYPDKTEPIARKRSRYYDQLMLHVLQNNLYPGDLFFGRLFRKNPVARILAFLNAETSFWQELCIMQTSPILVFITALWRETYKHLQSGKRA